MSLLKIQDRAFTVISYVNYVVYFLVLFGLSYLTPKSVETLNKYMPLYISLFLLIRFNPLTNHTKHFTELDRKIAFASGTFLFFTTAVGAITQQYLDSKILKPVQQKIKKIEEKK